MTEKDRGRVRSYDGLAPVGYRHYLQESTDHSVRLRPDVDMCRAVELPLAVDVPTTVDIRPTVDK